MQSIANSKLKRRSDKQWDRIVMAEVLIPGTPNVFGDLWTEEGIQDAVQKYMVLGYIIDVEHDMVDVTGKAHVVESFIAREGDTTFIPGSWVIGMYIPDDDLWDKVLSGEINGFSFEAVVSMLEGVLVYEDDNFRTG